jgi:hypothetical protein
MGRPVLIATLVPFTSPYLQSCTRNPDVSLSVRQRPFGTPATGVHIVPATDNCVSIQLLIGWILEVLFSGVKRPKRETDIHLHLISKVKIRVALSVSIETLDDSMIKESGTVSGMRIGKED